ncbi:MAG: hypothetical protein JSR48_03820 [Verrucomicrobia bacterium]|nr:hypothetical protein [Verrucomicrobiota bacterium]
MKQLSLLILIGGFAAGGLLAQESPEIKLPAPAPAPAAAPEAAPATAGADHPAAPTMKKHAKGHKQGKHHRKKADPSPAPKP